MWPLCLTPMDTYYDFPNLSGIMIRGGNANGQGNNRGGGLIANPGSPILREVVFLENYAESGGGAYISSLYNGEVLPEFYDVTFTNNIARLDGGGLFILYGAQIERATFLSNHAKQRGGGIFAQAQGPTISNVVFNSNTAGQSGGGIYNNGARTKIYSSTFYNNAAFPNTRVASTGGAIASYNAGVDIPSTVEVYNSILWGNQSQTGPQSFVDVRAGSSTAFSYSLIQGWVDRIWNTSFGTSIVGNMNQDPAFIDADGLDAQMGTLDDDLHLAANSPARDKGSNAYFPGWLLYAISMQDRDGNSRYDMGSNYDIGAYEGNPIVYVDKAAAGGLNDGSSWQNAYTNLAYALSYGYYNAEIWVAAGTYRPGFPDEYDPFNRNLAFSISNRVLYGGFAGNETSLQQRDLTKNQTILDGDLKGDDIGLQNNADNSYHVVTTYSSSTVLDGFTIRGGNANDGASVPNSQGGGISANYSSPVLRNVLLTENEAIFGGALAISDSGGYVDLHADDQQPAPASAAPPPVSGNVVFRGNHAVEQGGAVWNEGADLTLNRAAFINNDAPYGAGIYNTGSLTLTNSVFRENTADYTGGAIDHRSNWRVVSILNSTFAGNSANEGGAIAFGDSQGPTQTIGSIQIGNSIFWGNSSGQGNAIVIRSELAKPTFGYSLVQGSGGSEAWNPAFGLDGGSNLDVDPVFAVPDLRLSVFSPAVDRGSNDLVPETANRDLAGFPRILGGTVDLGAYETSRSNNTWPTAAKAMPDPTPALALASTINTVELSQVISVPGQSRWYKVPIDPDSRLTIALTNLPANYDLTVYKDIPSAFEEILTQEDLIELNAEFAPDMYSPDMYSPDMYSPDMYSPDMYSPDMYSPDMYSPDMYSPDMYSPDMYSPDMYSPDMYSPDMYSPDMYSPDMYSPDMYSPDMYSPDSYMPDMTPEEIMQAFSSAQSRSLVGISALNGTANENLSVNTWNNTGHYYVRVNGRNGAYDPDQPFHLSITRLTGQCSGLVTHTGLTGLSASAGNYQTLVLVDWSRLTAQSSPEAVAALTAKVNSFAGTAGGVVLDVDQDPSVKALNTQADANTACPYAKNLVAYAIKDVIDLYWAKNPELKYIVLVGNDNIIPFYRQPDFALLGSESNYVPPVMNETASQASLRSNFVLTQDGYGARKEISFKTDVIYIPDLAVGRLVETPAEIGNMLDAYAEGGGKITSPQTALVTGYDFLADAAEAVRADLTAGLGSAGVVTPLISARDLSPSESWTAGQLKALLLGERHDIIYLAGHFSAGSTLAADNTTRVTALELDESTVNLKNALIYSAGCHSGYNLVNEHGFPISPDPDWAQAFARKGATAIAGTGYQYGDTDFIEYSERLYYEFTRQLRAGSGDRSVGQALVAAKQIYLMDTAELRGIHVKAVSEATLFGLPMIKINMPGERYVSPTQTSIVPQSSMVPFATNPGKTLGLYYADINLNPVLETKTKILKGLGGETFTATYLQGKSGVKANPFEPVLPLDFINVSDPTGQRMMRGVGFLGGTYQDFIDILPLTGAAATEIRGTHTPFYTQVFYPVRPWATNYLGEFFRNGAAQTRLAVMPAQYISEPLTSPTGRLRKFTQMQFRLFYSGDVGAYGEEGVVPAQSSPPAIHKVLTSVDSSKVDFQVEVLGDPSAGIQKVWITYTSVSGALYGQWKSLELAQNIGDSRVWENSLLLLSIGNPADLRFVVQAVNGVGLVTLSTNLGAYYTPGVDPGAGLTGTEKPVTLTLAGPASGAYGTEVTLESTLSDASGAVAGKLLTFKLGPQQRSALTDANGKASVRLLVLGAVGPNKAQVTLEQTPEYAFSSQEIPFEILKQDTRIAFEGQSAMDGSVIIVLQDATGRPLGNKAVFVVEGTRNSFLLTDFTGRVAYTPAQWNSRYVVYFNGQIPLNGQTLMLDDERYNAAVLQWGSFSLDQYLPLLMRVTP
jgi:predicted outer membrane repeat protein